MIGIEFAYKDGSKEWFDPVNEDEFEDRQTNEVYVFYVGQYEYKTHKENINNVRKYKLCEICGFEKNTCGHEEKKTCVK